MTLLENCEAETENCNVALCGATFGEIGLLGLNRGIANGGAKRKKQAITADGPKS